MHESKPNRLTLNTYSFKLCEAKRREDGAYLNA